MSDSTSLAYRQQYKKIRAKFFKSCGVNYSLIGHSERRTLFGETNGIVRKKAEVCIENQITPIICIGESEALRNSGSYKEFLLMNKNFKFVIFFVLK